MDWIKNLPPEDFIYMIGGFLLLVLVIVVLIKVMKIAREIGSRALKMTEEIISQGEQTVTNIKVVNRSYIDNELTEIGMIYKKKKVIILDAPTRVNARDRFELVVPHAEIRKLLQVKEFKIKKIKFYYESSIGNLVKASGKLTKKNIKKALKEEKKQFKADQKAKRYEEGNFTACDRISIFFGNIFGPIKKARHKAIIKRNKKIADRRVEKEVEAERERLIEQQKLIYEQQLREARKEELRNEYKIDELKATLEDAETNPKPIVLEEKDEPVKESKKEKRAKKQSKQQEIDELLEEEKTPGEEKVDDSKPLTVEELLEESLEDETKKE